MLQSKINSMRKTEKPRSSAAIVANANKPWELTFNVTISCEDGRDISSLGLFPIVSSLDQAVQEELYSQKILSQDKGLNDFGKRLGTLS